MITSVQTQTDRSHLKKLYYKSKERTVAQQTSVTKKPKDVQVLIIQCCEFEIFGIVQDVSFRHYTLRRAQKLGVRGWCMYTDNSTVKGLIQGYPKSFEAMRIWLKYTGSPTSRIDKCVFGPIEELQNFTYADFTIKKVSPDANVQ
ncbi:acylphosphatase-1 isoform X2 [Drosophila virilis]|uniref:acylphosphatase-1 isoform X2 n=1 Tax=Drosophila virilis TaxID=7244 RepID=UPI0038B3A6B1